MNLTPAQRDLLRLPLDRRIFLEGPAGSGKTTVAVQRMLDLLDSSVPGEEILVLVPQRTLAGPFDQALRSPQAAAGGTVDILTAGGLARRMVDLFWPLVAAEAGFAHPERPPAFLTLESAQYYMAHLVRPLLDEGLFESISIDRNRLYSQIIDNLNKAALVGFPLDEIAERLKSAWSGESSQLRVYDDAQRCAGLFRQFCLENNLLDFSLQVELFRRQLWPSLLCRAYLKARYRCLIADNLEEDTPFAHDLLAEWLPDFDSALLVFDQGAGYRRFLGADPASAQGLSAACDEQVSFAAPLVSTPDFELLAAQFGAALERPEALQENPPTSRKARKAWETVLSFPPGSLRFFPQMLDWVTGEVQGLLDGGTPPGEIALLAPLLPDALRFSLADRLDARGIPYRSHRPSRSLGDEPAARCLLTLARLAHPDWALRPGKYEVTHALLQSIAGLDLVRAQLLCEVVYRSRDGKPSLEPFERIRPETQSRITYAAGERYEALRAWLADYASAPAAEIDFFFSRLFGEVLAQPGFGFHANLDAGQVSANLIESAQKFRWAVEQHGALQDRPLGREYLEMVEDGVIAAQYVQNWQPPAADAVFIAPAYTFLMNNRPVDHQFWLDIGSDAWFERLYQPLTHPIVLSRAWPAGRLWTAIEELEYNRDTLYRLLLGLLRRCRVQVHLGRCDLSEGGYEQRGMLLRTLYQVQLQEGRDG